MIGPTSLEELRAWLAEPEGTRLEFKEAKTSYQFDRLVDYCVALGNEGGGKVLLGITDRRPRRIVGSAAFAEPGRTEAGLHTRLAHRIPVEEMRTPDGRVLVVHVPSRLPGTAWHHNGRYLKRAGDDLTALSSAELQAMFSEAGPDFSAQVCAAATLTDLSADAIARFREKWAEKTNDARRLTWSDAQTLADAELTVNGGVTHAALVLFGTRAALGLHLAQAELVFEYRSSEASGPAAERVEYREGFLLWRDDIWGRINLRNDRQSYQDGLFRKEIPTFDEVSVREALLNAIAHRDYRLGGSVFVRQYARRLEIVSPGGFPAGVTLENILDQQNPRNRRLAEALAKVGLIERSGQGMNLMYESAVLHGKTLPSFDGTTDNEVRLTLSGTLNSPELVRFIERLGSEKTKNFSTYDYLVMDLLSRDQEVPTHLKKFIPALVSVGAVEAVGYGRGTRHMLARDLYASLRSKGSYTRRKGLDRSTNKALLLKHITDNARTGSQMDEFRQVLPALSRDTLRGLLRELQRDDLAHTVGVTKAARWYPGPAPIGSEAGDKAQ